MGARRRAGLPPLPPPPPPIRAPLYFSESASLPPSGRVFLQLRPGGRDSRRPLTPQPGAGKLSAAARTARLRSAARRLLRSGRASPRARPVLHLAGSPQHPGLWRPAPTQILYTIAYVRVDEHTIGDPEDFCQDWINHVSH